MFFNNVHKIEKKEKYMFIRNQVMGMFLLSAIGDALGIPIETLSRDEIARRYGRVEDYLSPKGHKWYDAWQEGRWSDDTQLTLAITDSLTACHFVDLDDIARCHLSAYEECSVGWGGSTKSAMERLRSGVHWKYSGTEGGYGEKGNKGKGNGVAMKIAPLAAFYAAQFPSGLGLFSDRYIQDSIRSLTFMTHRSGMALGSASAQIAAVMYCLHQSAENFNSIDFARIVAEASLLGERLYEDTDTKDRLTDRLNRLMQYNPQEIAKMNDEEIERHFGSGKCYVYESLPVAHALFLRNPHSIETLYDAVNFGEDTDTIGAIVGALLGALNGAAIIPEHLRAGLWQKERVIKTAERFCDQIFLEE